MPTFEIPVDGGMKFTDADHAVVLSHMYWPEDEEARRVFAAAFTRVVILSRLDNGEDAASFSRSGKSPAHQREIMSAYLRAPEIEDLLSSTIEHKGNIAGLILYYLQQATGNSPEDATINRAKRLAVSLAKRNQLPHSPQTIEGAWQSHRGVSHFWAAMWLLRALDVDWLSPNEDVFPIFLAIADGYRQFGEGFKIGMGNMASVALDPDRTWRAATSLSLPEIELPAIGASDEALAIARDRKIKIR